MYIVNLASTAAALVADGKGILAADETPKTLTKRFDALTWIMHTNRPLAG
jgi:fructose-bisphosphate aldolase class 1